MNARSPISGIRLSLLDYLISVMDSHQSHLDFTTILRFKQPLDFESLRNGASSSRNLFPTTGSTLKGNRWIRDTLHRNGIAAAEPVNIEAHVKNFVNRPIDLSHELPVQQLVISSPEKNATTMVTKFHHAAADGTSAALWINHQLAVALGFETARKTQSDFEQLHLKQLSRSVRRSKFAYPDRADRLWTLPEHRSGVRAWTSINFDANSLRKACRRARGFTYNDLLATAALEVFGLWNRERHGDHQPKVGLWLPINIRRRSAEGFGNGTSRIRIYANYSTAMSFADKCRDVRHQIGWCTTHGEWVVPQASPITALPQWVTRPILRRHLTRPSIDMATGIFSHAEQWNTNSDLFSTLERVECVGLLHPFQALAINGATHNGRTWLTFTYDANLFEAQHIERLVDLYAGQIELAKRTLQ